MEFNQNPTITEGDGDGQVNRRSLIGCMHWKNDKNHRIYVQEFSDGDHIGILGHSAVKDYILKTISHSNSNKLSES